MTEKELDADQQASKNENASLPVTTFIATMALFLTALAVLLDWAAASRKSTGCQRRGG